MPSDTFTFEEAKAPKTFSFENAKSFSFEEAQGGGDEVDQGELAKAERTADVAIAGKKSAAITLGDILSGNALLKKNPEAAATILSQQEQAWEPFAPDKIIGTLAHEAINAPMQAGYGVSKLMGAIPKDTAVPEVPPLISQESAAKTLRHALTGATEPSAEAMNTPQQIKEGVIQGVAGLISGGTSPETILGIAAGTKYPEAVLQLFKAAIIQHLPESIANVWKSKTPQEVARSVTELTGEGLTLGAMSLHGETAPVSETTLDRLTAEAKSPETKAAVTVGPATAAAVAETKGTDALPVQIANESLLRETRSQVGLQEVGARDTQPQEPATTQSANAQGLSGGAQGEAPNQVAESSVTNPVTEPAIVGMGGAVPGEFDASFKTATGIKNATVDQERVSRGLPAAMDASRRSFGNVWDEAMAKIDRNPESQDALIDELRNKPRALTDTEDAMLLHRQIDLQNEFGKATRDLAQAFEDGRMEDVQQEKIRVAGLSDKLLDIYNIGKRVGTETGRGLNARKMMANEDFTLAAMTTGKRAALGGRPLTEAEASQIQQLHDKIAETQKALDEYKAKADSKIADLEFNNAVLNIVKDATGGKLKPTPPGVVSKFISDRANEARARLKKRMAEGRQLASIDPLDLASLADNAIIGADYLAKGIIRFAEWSAKMKSDLGDWIEPHLKQIFAKSHETLKTLKEHAGIGQDTPAEQQITVEGMKARMAEGDTVKDLGRYIQKLAEQFVASGIKERDPLIDAVHSEVKNVLPDISRREVMDAISGYGDFKPLNPDKVKAELRDLKGQMQQVGKLEDMQKGQAPAKTGVERRTPSDEERRLIKQVNELKKKGGFTVTDPAKQLKSALDSIKARLKNQIADLDFQISTGKKIVREKGVSPTDTESDLLRKQRDDLKSKFDEVFGKAEMADEQRVKLAMNAVEKSIADIETRIKNKDLGPRTKESKTPNTPELEAARARRDALKEELQEMRDLADPKKTPEEIALQSLKTRLKNRTAELLAKSAAGDFSPRPKRTITLDTEAQRLKAENESAKKAYQEGLAKDRLANRTRLEKMQDTLVKWRRGFLLSGPVTLAKLTSAAVQRFAFTAAEEGIGAGISKVISGVAARAPREGGASVRIEANAITQGFTQGMKDAWQTLKTGHSELDTIYGKPDLMPRSVVDFFGALHGALKAPTKRAEFTRAFEKRIEHAIANGIDASDPMVQTRLAVEAYKDAQRSIFMQDNRVVSAYKRALNALEAKSKVTGETPVSGKAAATVAKVLLPIVKVPTNIVAETMQYALGSVTGSVRLANAFRKGIETLPPEQADLIMRDLKKGALGAAVLTLGFLNPQVIGGYYQAGKKQRPDEVKYGRIRVFGHDIPSFLLHNPLLEVAQLGATIRKVADSKLRKKDADTQGIGPGIIAGALGLLEEVPFAREMAEVAKAFNPRERGAFFGELSKSMIIPQAVQWLASATDKNPEFSLEAGTLKPGEIAPANAGETTKRKPSTVWQHIETGIPGLRKNVPRNPKQ